MNDAGLEFFTTGGSTGVAVDGESCGAETLCPNKANGQCECAKKKTCCNGVKVDVPGEDKPVDAGWDVKRNGIQVASQRLLAEGESIAAIPCTLAPFTSGVGNGKHDIASTLHAAAASKHNTKKHASKFSRFSHYQDMGDGKGKACHATAAYYVSGSTVSELGVDTAGNRGQGTSGWFGDHIWVEASHAP